ncbi:hypothetical protein QYS62_001874 [Fusarium acuminatum]|uniref:Uncharacterized protein n=1 Tax=Fusarium acuminatum TaxID=5515 RepID=A0ABZ2WL16_9HYPO
MVPPRDDSDIGSRIVFMINLGMKVRNIGIDVCTVAEIFEGAGVRREQARQCWDGMVNRLMYDEFLKATTISNYGGWKSLYTHIEETLALQGKTDNIVCMPASLLASAIAAVAFRKLRPRSGKASQAHRDFTMMFGDMNVIQWLPIAIRVWERTVGRPFIIELDQEVSEPVIHLETREGQRVWIVKTRQQAPNIYESVFRDAIGTNNRDEEDTKPMAVPSNVCDLPLPSVENDERTPSKSTLPSTLDSRIDNDTLREYAREMKKLGKRLSSPERATVKRLRRGISEFADHADKKDQDVGSERNVKESERQFKSGRKSMKTTVPKAKKPFDVYGHYKAL